MASHAVRSAQASDNSRTRRGVDALIGASEFALAVREPSIASTRTPKAAKEPPITIARDVEPFFTRPRKDLIDWVRQQLVGPPERATNEKVTIDTTPTERFPCGALYPASEWGEGFDPVDGDLRDDETRSQTAEVLESESLTEQAHVRRYTPPSSLGCSFFISGMDIRFKVQCSAAKYEPDGEGNWVRQPLDATTGCADQVENISCPGRDQRRSFSKFGEIARLDVQWRRFPDGWIVTVSLCNTQQLCDSSRGQDYLADRARMTLFEASLQCTIEAGEIGVYPRVDQSLLDPEEQEIELQYAHRHVYAIGHGCAADWTIQDGKVVGIRSETMPSVEVPTMTADTGSAGESVLSLANLAAIDSQQDKLLAELELFVSGYSEWVEKEIRSITTLPPGDREVAGRLVRRMGIAVSRMQAGINLLRMNAQARFAFGLANLAMLNQMRQNDRQQGAKPKVVRDDEDFRWRPFQLAFLLTTLESTANVDSECRDTVDLIWFPTGGGKTEAYLGLTAFQIALRRLRHSDTGGGTTVLMRYTLRLLTRDQFLRAARLICALELIRRDHPELGTAPITIGMWVGKAISPNSFRDADELVRNAASRGARPALVLDDCPWCGTEFSAPRNYCSSAEHFRFLCRNPACEFGAAPDGVLPCNVVDEALYKDPPTMLVATVDKFARLAWEERANAFFGGNEKRPPELIIQDELHLIASSLGSIAGLYEAAIDTVIQLRGGYPKYIASTATIRMAEQQVKRLYGRAVAVFPPPGLSQNDAYFARSVPLEERPGRIYVGYLAPLLNRQKCMSPLVAALRLAPRAVFGSQAAARDLMDAWWTQVVYHGSLKSVGNSHTAYMSEVRDYLKTMSSVTGNSDGLGDGAREHEHSESAIAQLTSLQTAAENAHTFARLKITRDEAGCLDAVLATNMISVGLDVHRLALMIINGQPMSTAEYIQSSSRVGRSDVPGIVFVNYYRDQTRSLSHYESFRPYHEAFYRFVEPTSVTPYTYQARGRALPAALVIVMRHAVDGMLQNSSAVSFDPTTSAVVRAIEMLKRRCARADSRQAAETSRHIDSLVNEWKIAADSASKYNLNYRGSDSDGGADRLLYSHEDRVYGVWKALQSMRHVEKSALLKPL